MFLEENENNEELNPSNQEENNSNQPFIKEPEPGIDIFTTQEKDSEEDEKDFDKLLKYIQNKNIPALRDFVSKSDPIDLAYLINDIPDDNDVVFFFKSVPNEYTASIFSYLSTEQQEKIVRAFSSKDVQNFISEMPNDDLADFVEELPSNLVNKVLSATPAEDRRAINQLLNYKEDTAGSIMTTEYVSIKYNTTAKAALDKIKQVGREAETIITTFVVDSSRRLIGSLSIEELIFADENTIVDNLMDKDCTSVVADTDQEEVAALMKKYDMNVIPVIDKERRMLGIITVDDIMDVIEQEQTEDIAVMAGVRPSDNDVDYLKTSVFKLAWARVPWLAVLLICDTFSGMLINNFESLLGKVPVLSVFIPMLMDTGGNSGGQATTIVTRALSLDQIAPKDFLKVMFKELRVSFIVGLLVGIVNFCWMLIEFYGGIIANTSTFPNWQIALLVAATGFGIIVLAKTIGSSLPLLAKKIHIDPAIMAGPLITSIVDSASLALYFLLARLILQI